MNRRGVFGWIALMPLLGNRALASEIVKVGEWYDDLGSPNYFDAMLTIESEDGRFFIVRRMGDGSGSRWRLDRKGESYYKVGDKFGAMYKITAKGLEIHDSRGLIRIAKVR